MSLIGVGLLLREASRRGVINITIEMRLIAVAAFGLALLAIGWRLRHKNPVYGLSLQGGSVAMLYLTTYASFAVYDVLPAAPAAVLVIVVTVGAGFLSVAQDSPPLAVLGIIGGFLAPVLTYTSPDDHVAVFGFYAVLSAAIVAVAWYKTWPQLNLLGLGFTFGIAAFWLWRRFDEDNWAEVQPLIGVLILLYLAIPVLFAIREAPDLRRPSTAPLVFGTPFLGFGLQYLAVGHTAHGMAVSAASLALVHGALAVVAHRLGRECRPLAEANVGLGVAFAAIAVPLAFDAHLTAVVWAAQGGLLVWIGCRRTRMLAVAAGGFLQVIAGAAFLGHLLESLPYPQDALPVANEFFLGAAVLAGTGLITGRMVHGLRSYLNVEASVPWLALVWGAGWWITGGLAEVGYQLSSHRLAVSLCFVVLSFGAASMFADRLRWPHLHALGVAIGPTLWLAAVVSLISQGLHPLDRYGWAAWPVSLAVFYWFLRAGEDRFLRAGEDRFLRPGEDRLRPLAGVLHGGAYWLVALLAVSEVYWQTDRAAEGVWLIVAPAAAGTALAAAALVGGRWLRWPLLAHRRVYVSACAGPTLLVVGAVVGAACLVSAGDPSPLPYVPLLNPLIVLLAALVGVVLVWVAAVRSGREEPATGDGPPVRALAVAAGGVAVATMELARTIHHWWDVPWDPEALIDSTAFQASLSILWTLIALAAMVAGARSGRRAAWVWGGWWMAVVLVKLLAADLNNLTAPGRATSFIATGVLLLVVGYLAPVAPGAPAAAAPAAGPEPGPQLDRPAAEVAGFSGIDGEWPDRPVHALAHRRQLAGKSRGAGLAGRCGHAVDGGRRTGSADVVHRDPPRRGHRGCGRAAGTRMGPAPEPARVRAEPSGRRDRPAACRRVRGIPGPRRDRGRAGRGGGGRGDRGRGGAVGRAGLPRPGCARHRRRVPGAGADLHELRRSRPVVRLLRHLERGHRRGGVVQGLARAQPARPGVHLRHRGLVASGSLRPRRLDGGAAPHRRAGVAVHVHTRDLGPARRPRDARDVDAPAGVRHAVHRARRAAAAGRPHRVRAGRQRPGPGAGAGRAAPRSSAAWAPAAASSQPPTPA